MIKQIFNWTTGSFFRTIGRIIAYFLIGILLAMLLSKANIDITNLFMPKLSAATLTSYDTYQKIWNEESGCGTANKYSYTQYANNNPGNDLWQQGSFGTQYSGKAAMLGFNFQYSLTAGKYYDIEVNFNTSDLSSSLNTTNVFLESGTSCQDTTGNRVSLIGFSLSNSGTNYSNKATIRIMANSATTYWGFYFYKGVGQYVTGVNNWRVNSLTINEVTDNSTNVVIDNATNNTINIINNDNENTQHIIDNQNELLGGECTNLLDPQLTTSLTHRGITFTPTFRNGKVSAYSLSGTRTSGSNAYASIVSNISLPSGTKIKTYGASNVCLQIYTTGQSLKIICGETTLTQSYNNVSLAIYTTGSSFDGEVFYAMVSPTTTNYCLYGSKISKIDETTDAINDVNNNLKDTDTSADSNNAANYINNFSISSHGLISSIILLPVNLLNVLIDGDSTEDLCTSWKGKDICLPNGNLIWGSNSPLINTFKLFFNLVVGGFLSYKCLSSLVRVVEEALQPDKAVAEVMKL